MARHCAISSVRSPVAENAISPAAAEICEDCAPSVSSTAAEKARVLPAGLERQIAALRTEVNRAHLLASLRGGQLKDGIRFPAQTFGFERKPVFYGQTQRKGVVIRYGERTRRARQIGKLRGQERPKERF